MRRPEPTEIDATIIGLHAKKSAKYGNSWRKRGELISIFSNITRKYDRLENAIALGEIENLAARAEVTSVEPVLDTVADLVVYTLKYLTFLAEQQDHAFPVDVDPSRVADFEQALSDRRASIGAKSVQSASTDDLERIFEAISVQMSRIEVALTDPAGTVSPADKVRSALTLATLSLEMLDTTSAVAPAAWDEFAKRIRQMQV